MDLNGDERMNMRNEPKEHLLFSTFLLFYIVYSNQVGIGVLGFQRVVVQAAGHDAWISVLLAGMASHLAAWMILKTLHWYPTLDLYGLHHKVYGKWLGGLFSCIYVAYLLMGAVIVLRNYIEVVQAWMFPDLPTWVLALFLIGLAIYAILGGIRVVAGVCFLSVIFTIWMGVTLYYPLQYAEWRNLLPVFEAGMKEIWQGTRQMSLTIIGFEILYFIYPYLKDKEKAPRYTHLALFVTTMVYLLAIVTAIVYFSKEQLMHTIWATLSFWKIIQLPNIERFEYIGIALWMLVILPNLILYLWAATRGMKAVFQWKQKHALYFFSIVIFLACLSLETRQQINQLNDFSGKYSPYLVFAYPFLLNAILWFRRKYRNKKAGDLQL